MRLVVDPVRCDGRGVCAELLPWLITLDDWGFPIVGEAEIDERGRAEIQETVRVCPRLALRLTGSATER